ncbi:MAG: DUF1800 domain-containing protein [Chloroflexi bacterium]|nr:DUF1800 domain-containing protein [Chloroflexota bacterium]
MSTSDIALIAHLMRRAGFGATRAELEAYAVDGYEATVDRLLDSAAEDDVPMDMLYRYHPDHSGMIGTGGVTAYWLYRMVNSKRPLQEKVALFWHGIFATGYSKLTQGRVLMDQIDMFRRQGMGDVRTLLVELSRDPSMILWLDNHDNHKTAINENFGRELLELFSMGVGNYSEDDIKEAARAFTGWTIGNAGYMERRAQNDSLWPYGRLNLHFEYRPEDHDDGEKSFLGETGKLTGEDIVEIICRQPATARFMSRHMYSFFVADEPPVTQWPYSEPRDPAAIEILSRAYFESGYDVGEMLRVMFNSDFFKSRDSWYEKVKSPAELVSGVLRLTGELNKPDPKLQGAASEMSTMGQSLLNPPSVEGWHAGVEWIDTGNLVERINFASERFSDVNQPGIKAMIGKSMADAGGVASPERLVQSCLDQLGAIEVSEPTRAVLLAHAENLKSSSGGHENAVGEMLRLVASTPEFQKG